jgi:hypothetical protein
LEVFIGRAAVKVSAVPPDRHPEPGFSLSNEIVDFLVKIPTI